MAVEIDYIEFEPRLVYPGQAVNTTFTIYNNDSAKQMVHVTFYIYDPQSEVFYKKDWKLDMDPQERIPFTGNIQIPYDAMNGEYNYYADIEIIGKKDDWQYAFTVGDPAKGTIYL